MTRGNSLNLKRGEKRGDSLRRKESIIHKQFLIRTPKTDPAGTFTKRRESRISSTKLTPIVKNFSLSTRQNTLESDELDQKGSHRLMQLEFRKISIHKKPLENIFKEKPKSKISSPAILPKNSFKRKILIRAETEIIPEDLDHFEKGSHEDFSNLNPSLKKVQGLEVDPYSLQTQKNEVQNSELTNQSTKLNSSYYHEGLLKYWHTKDEKYVHYFNHLKKSHFSLREISSDCLPANSKKDGFFSFKRRKDLVLALDLDETLIHCCNYDPPEMQRYQYAVNYRSEKGVFITAKINLRPHLEDFLVNMSNHFDLVVYTASEREYALAIVNFIDPQRKFILDVFHRDSCLQTKKGFVVKDLSVILPGELQKIVLVDNSSHCFAPQLSNGIPITSFTYDQEDRELLHLQDFLLQLRWAEDIPSYLRKAFKLHLYESHHRLEDLLAWISKTYTKLTDKQSSW